MFNYNTLLSYQIAELNYDHLHNPVNTYNYDAALQYVTDFVDEYSAMFIEKLGLDVSVWLDFANDFAFLTIKQNNRYKRETIGFHAGNVKKIGDQIHSIFRRIALREV